MKTFKLLYARWIGPTPDFFKIIIWIGLFCGTLGGGLKAASNYIPDKISNIAGYLVTTGIASATVAKFTVKDDKDIQHKAEEILHSN